MNEHDHSIEINVILNSADNGTDHSPIFIKTSANIGGTYDYMYHDSDNKRIPRLTFSNISGDFPKIYYTTITGYTHKTTSSGAFTGTAGTTDGNSGNTESAQPTFTGTSGTTDSTTSTFTGTAGTTGANGSGTSFSI